MCAVILGYPVKKVLNYYLVVVYLPEFLRTCFDCIIMPRQSKNSGHVGFPSHALDQGASYLFTFMALAIIIPDVSVYFQLCFVPFVVYILCVISYLQLTPGCISNKSKAECVFDYYVRADKQHKF